jgi:hypothetical protein
MFSVMSYCTYRYYHYHRHHHHHFKYHHRPHGHILPLPSSRRTDLPPPARPSVLFALLNTTTAATATYTTIGYSFQGQDSEGDHAHRARQNHRPLPPIVTFLLPFTFHKSGHTPSPATATNRHFPPPFHTSQSGYTPLPPIVTFLLPSIFHSQYTHHHQPFSAPTVCNHFLLRPSYHNTSTTAMFLSFSSPK